MYVCVNYFGKRLNRVRWRALLGASNRELPGVVDLGEADTTTTTPGGYSQALITCMYVHSECNRINVHMHACVYASMAQTTHLSHCYAPDEEID